MYGTSQPKIGELLVSSGLITPEQRDHLLEVQKEKGGKFGELAIAEEMITEDDLLNILSSQLNIPVVNLEEAIIDPKVPLLLPSKIAQRYSMLPIEETENKIVIAVADPTNIQGIDDAKMMLNKDVELVLCRKADLLRNIDDYYGGVESVQELLEGITEEDIELVKDEADLTGNGAADIEDNRIVKYVNLIILEAIKNHASDVHLEPFENEFVIRQRIDGVLHKMPAPPKQVQNAVISRIKVMADLNIAESRLPQDGRIKLRLAGKEIDLRVSSLPTVFGESVVLRLLDRTAQILTLEQLGMSDETRIKMEKIIENPNGIVVVTGPTGCGKTSSLYACVVKLHNPEDKFITVEDPVEYEIDTLTQVQVHEKVGLTFGATLRSILRQDPDIILVGEIRDVETAEISIQASLTGHLVLTTLHTNEAAGSITRLIDMGIEPFLLTSTILAVCGQRLVRMICPMCKEVADIDKEKLKLLAPPNTDISKITLYRGRGCEECTGTGYKGRTGIFELFIMSEEIQELVLQKAPANVLHAKAQELGMVTMAMDGWNKVMQGITTLEEVHRVAPLKTS